MTAQYSATAREGRFRRRCGYPVVAGFKQRVRQLRIHKRLAAGKGDPAAAAVVEGFIAQYGRHDLFDLLFFAATVSACVGQQSVRASSVSSLSFSRWMTVPFSARSMQPGAACWHRSQPSVHRRASNSTSRLRERLSGSDTSDSPASSLSGIPRFEYRAVVGGVTLYIEDHFLPSDYI